MTDNQSKSINPTQGSSSPTGCEVDSFLADLRRRRNATGDKPPARGRLVFGLDATASRQPTWDTACQLQAEMFREATAVGHLELQLVFYRGLGECRSSRWIADSAQLAKTMSQIVCNAGQTQIEKILTHTQKETKLLRVSALVFVGDAMEENPDTLTREARRAWTPRRSHLHVPRRPRSRCRAGLSRARSGDPRCLLPLRSRRSTPTGRASARRSGLCRRWDDRTRCSPRSGRGQAAEPDEIAALSSTTDG